MLQNPPIVTYLTSFVVADATTVTDSSGYHHYIQSQNMDMNQNQQEPIQQHVPITFYDFFQNHKMNMNQNQQEPVQYQAPNLNLDLNLDSSHNLNLDLNLNSNQI